MARLRLSKISSWVNPYSFSFKNGGLHVRCIRFFNWAFCFWYSRYVEKRLRNSCSYTGGRVTGQAVCSPLSTCILMSRHSKA